MHIQRIDNYNMAPQPQNGEPVYNSTCQAEYNMTGHSSGRNAQKMMEDDLNGMPDT